MGVRFTLADRDLVKDTVHTVTGESLSQCRRECGGLTAGKDRQPSHFG